MRRNLIEKVAETPEKKYEDGYDEKLSIYLKEQISSKLDEMKSSEIISASKYSKIKEM
jgi:transcriptional regulatory protein LevR